MVHTHNRILFSYEKKYGYIIYNTLSKHSKHTKKPEAKHIFYVCIYEIPIIAKSIEIGNILVIARGWGLKEEEWGVTV